jgi:hypothetical protein
MGKGITLAKEELEKLKDVIGGIKRIGHKTESVLLLMHITHCGADFHYARMPGVPRMSHS